jgi:hypothetical protein
MARYPAPGRGSWRLAGGLLPAKPGSKSKVGYYRLSTGAEAPIGSSWLEKKDTSHEAYCVYLGVRAIQELVKTAADGWFGPVTAKAVVAAQTKAGIEADGIVGPASMKAFLTPLISDLAVHNNVPVAVLGGLLVHESILDPAAVGVTGQDHGIAQINLGAHPTTTVEQALDPDYSIMFSVEDLAQVHQIWKGRTKADPWDIAIASHNSPLLAKKWAVSGSPPFVQGRVFQIEEYVRKVHESW